MFFKTSNKKAFPLVVRNMEEVDFHSFVILYWKLSLMWPGGRGGDPGGRKRTAEEPRTLPVLLPQARPASSLGRTSQPAAWTCVHSARITAGRKKNARPRPPAWAEKPSSAGSPTDGAAKRTQRLRRDRFPPVGEGTLQPPPPLPEREASRCGQVGGSLGRPGSPSAAPCGAAGAARSVSFRRAGPGSLPSPPPSRLYTRTIDPASTPPYPGTICAARGGF